MDYLKQNHLSILIIAFLVVTTFFGGAKGLLGVAANVTTIGNPWQFTSTVKFGPNGATITELNATLCNLIGSDSSQAASTTLPYDCVVTGVATADVVFASLATSTSRGGSSNWEIVGAKASTTAGFVTVMLYNSGPAAIPSVTSVGSSTNVLFIDN